MEKRKVQVVIFHYAKDNKKHFLLLKMNESRGFFWQNVTGGVEKDEDFEDAAIREVIEETAITDEQILRLCSSTMEFSFHDQWGNDVIEKVFFLQTKDKWNVKIDPNEHCEFKWLSEDEIGPTSVHYSSNYEALNKAIQYDD